MTITLLAAIPNGGGRRMRQAIEPELARIGRRVDLPDPNLISNQ